MKNTKSNNIEEKTDKMPETKMDIKGINRVTFIERLKSYRTQPLSLILIILVLLAAVITVGVLLALVGYILIKGIPHLKPSLFAWKYTTENVSMMPSIINTIIVTLLALLVAVPIGVFSAVYLVEYAKRGNKLVKIVGVTAETLSGIPSIVYGLFGYLMFVIAFGWGYSILAGVFTLAIMILPTVMRTTEESLKSVPDSFREGSFGLGAGKMLTIFKVVLPSAVPGILAGVILATGRIIGETAALIYTTGTVAGIPSTLLGSGRTLSVHMYSLLNEGLYMDEAYATAVVILVTVVLLNALSSYIAGRVRK